MPQPYQTNNPLEFTELPGVYISEKAPPPSIVSSGANNIIFIGQFERGPVNQPTAIGSISELTEIFGNNPLYSGNKTLRLKRWTNLHVVRALASGAVAATVTQTVSTKDLITVTALYKGVYGNKIKVTVADGTATNTKKITIEDEGTSEIREVYDNLELAGKSDAELEALFGASTLVKITGAHASDEPENGALQLATGSDGTIAPSDYTSALNNSDLNLLGRIYFADSQVAGVKAALSNFVKTQQAGIAVVGTDSKATGVDDAITDAKLYLDANGRVLYAYNHLQFNVDGKIEDESPVYMAVSVLALTPAHVSPAAASSVAYTTTAVGVVNNINRTNQKKLFAAGIMAFENDPDLRGIKLGFAPTGNPQLTVQRRRMSDFYLYRVASFLKLYQSLPISQNLRSQIYSAIRNFDQGLINNGVLPSETDAGVRVLLIRTDLSTPQEEAQGILKVQVKRRLFAAADFIILEATIGETVEITETG